MCSRSTHIWGVEEILCAKTCPFSVIFYCALCQSKIQNGTCKNLASIAGVRKDLCNRCGYRGLILVEAGGVEPPSENVSTGTSPGAVGHLHSLTQAWADTLRGLVASLFMVRSKLCAHTCTTKRRPVPARGPSGRNGHGLSRDKLNVIVVL